jgi:hypothetical protein
MHVEGWALLYLQAVQVQNVGLAAHRAIVGGHGGGGGVFKGLRGWDRGCRPLLIVLLTLHILLPAGNVMQARVPCNKAHSSITGCRPSISLIRGRQASFLYWSPKARGISLALKGSAIWEAISCCVSRGRRAESMGRQRRSFTL